MCWLQIATSIWLAWVGFQALDRDRQRQRLVRCCRYAGAGRGASGSREALLKEFHHVLRPDSCAEARKAKDVLDGRQKICVRILNTRFVPGGLDPW